MKKLLSALFVFSFTVVACSHTHKEVKPLKQTPAASAANALDLKEATQLLGQKRCPEAIQAFQKFLAKNPNDAGGWNMIGLAYLCNLQTDQAVSSLQKALQIAPTYTDVHNNLGVTYVQLKNYPLARNEFLKALEDTTYPITGPYFNLARLSFEQGNYEESRALSKKVMALTPKQVGPVLLYSLSLEKLGRVDEACASYRDVLKVAPDNQEATYNLAKLLLQKGQTCEARQYFNKVVDADPLGDLGQKSISALKNIANCPN